MIGFGDFGLSLILPAIGSCIGAAIAGQAAIGAWKKCYLQNRIAPFIIIAFVGAPLSQTIFGVILRNAIISAHWPDGTLSMVFQITMGLLSGGLIGYSAYLVGKAGAAAADALAETEKGFGNFIMVMGIIETVALFVMVFSITVIPK